jgi:hypothetical protein
MIAKPARPPFPAKDLPDRMFATTLTIEVLSAEGSAVCCPIRWIDNFAMRNFTNDAIFDDTFPVGDGLLEVGYRVPLDRLYLAMEDWFRRKGYLRPGERLRVSPIIR